MPTLKDAATVTLKLGLPAELYTAYDDQATRLGRPIEAVLVEQLTRFQTHHVDERPLVLTSTERELLEQTLAMPLLNSTALLRGLQRAADASLGGVKLAFEPWQLAELKRRAEKNGTTIKQETQKAVADVMRLAFHGMGG